MLPMGKLPNENLQRTSSGRGLRRQKPTAHARRSEQPAKRPVGRPTRLTAELADDLFDEVYQGGSMINQLRRHNIDAWTFYRWLTNNPEFRRRYEEAIAIRAWLIPERLWELSIGVTDKNCRSRKTQARLLEKAMAHINVGRRRWQGRS
jgi:hypothetical protein